MPIHLNLLAESRVADEMRRKDPIKRVLFIGISFAAIFIAWGLFVEVEVFLVKTQVTGIEQKIDVRTNGFDTATVNTKKITVAKDKIAALDKLQEARFLQGNLLDALQHATVDGVQLTQVRLSQSYSTATHDLPGGGKGKADFIEDISLHLEARDFSSNPGDQVNKFTETLANYHYFETMLGKTNSVRLAGPPSALQGEEAARYVTFAVECRFPVQTR